MDRLPRDIAAERMHHDILQLLDEYRVTSPTTLSLHNGLPTSPNGLHAYMHPHKTKSKQRRNKNNGQLKDHLSYSPEGNRNVPKKSKSKKKSASSHRNGRSHGGEGSSVGTLSPGDIVESPNGYDMTPPTYDNVCGQGNMMALHRSQMNGMEDVNVNCAQMPSRMDDHCVMSNHYKNDSMLEHHHRNMEMMSSEWLQSQQQHPMSQSPLATASIPTPPSSNPSHNSPLSMDGKLSPMKGKMLPTSPPHYLAMQNQAQRNRPQKSPHHYRVDNFSFEQQPNHMDNAHHNMQTYTIMYDNHHRQKVSTPMQIQHVPQYPTPPSQHSYLATDATPPQGLTALPENILTPSPDSPGHWSSSSPHSAHSDWSEGISSPVAPIGQQPGKGRNHISSDAVFI